jgi:hypothetical protein
LSLFYCSILQISALFNVLSEYTHFVGSWVGELHEVMERPLEYVELGPESKVVVDGLPRASLYVELGPLAACAEDVSDAVENITKCQGTGAARCRRVQGGWID